MVRQAFSDFIYSTKTDKSGKVSSSVRGLEMLELNSSLLYKVLITRECPNYMIDP